jgi:hypothetical protein
MAQIVDIRHLQPDPPGSLEIYKKKGGRPLVRDPAKIDTIMVHQTSTGFSANKRLAEKIGVHEALHRRGLDIKSHVCVFNGRTAGTRCNHVLITKPMLWYVYHGHKMNYRSVGIEIEGNFPLKYDPNSPMMTNEDVKAAQLGIVTLYREAKKAGCPIKYIVAHRQSSAARLRDPGEEIWRRVVLPVASRLGLELKPDYITGTGKPIPDYWGREVPPNYMGTALAVGGAAAAVFLGIALWKNRAWIKRASSRAGSRAKLSGYSTSCTPGNLFRGSRCKTTSSGGYGLFDG